MARLDALAQGHSDRAIETLAEIMNCDLEKASDRISAAKEILDRGYGKPAQAVIALPLNRQQRALLAAYSDEQLLTVVESQPLPRLEYTDAELVEAAQPAEPAVDPLLE